MSYYRRKHCQLRGHDRTIVRGQIRMQQQNIPIGTLVDMYKRGEMRLPEIQRHYVWRATRVRDLLDSLYRGYPSGSILMWETDEEVPLQAMAVTQQSNPYQSTRLLLD